MSFETDSLLPDPADEATLYAPVEAWEPVRRGRRRPRPARRSETVRAALQAEWTRAPEGPVSTDSAGTAPAQSVSLEFPTIWSDLLNTARPPQRTADSSPRSAETTNLVPQSAFLRGHPATQVVTQGTMPSSFQFLGDSMQKPDVFAARASSSSSPMPGLSHADFARPSSGERSERSGFLHSTPPSLCAERLDGYGARWLQSLPVSIRPLITAKRHPHIVNKLAILWGVDEAVHTYFDELLISSRPGRRGFAMEVLDELVELQRAVQEKRRF